MKKMLALLLAALLVAALAGPAGAGKKKKKAPAGPVVVFEDPAGDADNNQGLGQSIPGGFDLVEGTIAKEGKDKLKFVVTHADMPPTGTIGEAFRLIYGLNIGDTTYEFTVKSFDVGKPDVITSVLAQDPNGENRVGNVYQGVARFEECGTHQGAGVGVSFSLCEDIAIYDAVFDPAEATVTWVAEMKDLGVKKGSIISPGGPRADTGCMICWVPQYLERSLTPSSIIDAATPTEYKVP